MITEGDGDTGALNRILEALEEQNAFASAAAGGSPSTEDWASGSADKRPADPSVEEFAAKRQRLAADGVEPVVADSDEVPGLPVPGLVPSGVTPPLSGSVNQASPDQSTSAVQQAIDIMHMQQEHSNAMLQHMVREQQNLWFHLPGLLAHGAAKAAVYATVATMAARPPLQQVVPPGTVLAGVAPARSSEASAAVSGTESGAIDPIPAGAASVVPKENELKLKVKGNCPKRKFRVPDCMWKETSNLAKRHVTSVQ